MNVFIVVESFLGCLFLLRFRTAMEHSSSEGMLSFERMKDCKSEDLGAEIFSV